MTTAEQKDLVLRSFQMFRDPAVVPEFVHAGWVNHEARPENRHGLEGATGTVRALSEAFADLRWEPRHLLADGDMVAALLTMSGRHVAPFAGVEASGRPFSTDHVHLFRIAEGRLAEHWAVRNDLGMLRQLGALPG